VPRDYEPRRSTVADFKNLIYEKKGRIAYVTLKAR
jgi:hypothetical protein